MRQVIQFALISINIFPRITAFKHKRAFFVFRYNTFVLKWLPWQQQAYHSRISGVSNYSSIKFFVRISYTDGNIRDCLLLNCEFIISDVTQSIVLQFMQVLRNDKWLSDRTIKILLYWHFKIIK